MLVMEYTRASSSLFLRKMLLMEEKKKEVDQKAKKIRHYLKSLSGQKIANKFASK